MKVFITKKEHDDMDVRDSGFLPIIRERADIVINKGETLMPEELTTVQTAIKSRITASVERGLTEAEVIKAIFRPVISPKPKGCECSTCIDRRITH